MKTTESEENYLEIILVLNMIKPHVRAIDVAERLGYTKPSVSVALKRLRQKEHINVSEEGYITLTESGNKIANMIYDRHQLIYERFKELGVPEEIAFKDACKIEHRISTESFEALKKHLADRQLEKEM